MDDVRPHGKKIGLLWIGGFGFIAGLFALGLPFFAKQIPLSFEKKMASAIGRPSDVMKECPSKNNDAFSKLVSRLFPIEEQDHEFSIEIQVLHSPIINAVAYLGGQIFIFSGLIDQAQSPEELAGVIAHEIEHVKNRHLIQAMMGKLLIHSALATVFNGASIGNLISQIMGVKFTSAEEEEADRGALARLKKAEIDVKGFIDFFRRLERNNGEVSILSDHPNYRDRIAMAKNADTYKTREILSTIEWVGLKSICD